MSAKEVGLLLRKTRKDQNISIEEAGKHTLIRRHYLRALEDGELGILPSPVQVKGFLRAYASYLGLDSSKVFALLESRAEAEGEAVSSLESQSGESEEIVDKDITNSGTDQLFKQIGESLQKQREILEFSLEEVESNTHISLRHIKRLENGAFDQFPSPTQARGMLHNYANFLGMDADSVLLDYAEALQSRLGREIADEGQEPEKEGLLSGMSIPEFEVPSWVRRYFSQENIVIAIVAAMIIGGFAWGVAQIAVTSASLGSDPTAPALSDLLLSSPSAISEGVSSSPSPSAVSGDNGVAASATPTLNSAGTVQVANPRNVEIQLVPSTRVWVRVSSDGEVVFEGRLVPGQNAAFSANNEILVFTGNAAGIRVFLNGDDLGVQGIEGEVINLLYSADGLATPTPSSTPTIDPNAASKTPSAESQSTPSVDSGDGEQ